MLLSPLTSSAGETRDEQQPRGPETPAALAQGAHPSLPIPTHSIKTQHPGCPACPNPAGPFPIPLKLRQNEAAPGGGHVALPLSAQHPVPQVLWLEDTPQEVPAPAGGDQCPSRAPGRVGTQVVTLPRVAQTLPVCTLALPSGSCSGRGRPGPSGSLPSKSWSGSLQEAGSVNSRGNRQWLPGWEGCPHCPHTRPALGRPRLRCTHVVPDGTYFLRPRRVCWVK